MTVEYFSNLGYKIQIICEILGLNRSSYYKWKNREIPEKEYKDQELCELIIEYDSTYNHILGYRRMTLYINRLNKTNYSWKYIRRLMMILGIKSKIRQKRYNYIKVKPEQVGENILARDFSANYPNEKWLTDVTEFKVIGQKQKIYLCSILYLYDKSIVAYTISFRNDNKLVFDTFDKAITLNPTAKPIFHSDRGFQFTSKVFKVKLDQQGMIQSMSRVGKCIDNGPMEAFWGTLKSEMYYLNKFYTTDNLVNSIIEYIEFYNNKRFQAILKSLTPIEYRNQALLA